MLFFFCSFLFCFSVYLLYFFVYDVWFFIFEILLFCFYKLIESLILCSDFDVIVSFLSIFLFYKMVFSDLCIGFLALVGWRCFSLLIQMCLLFFFINII